MMKMRYIYTVEYYSAIKKEYNWVIHRDVNGPVSVIEREESQKEKTK